MSWLDNYSTTNTFRSMYINGFIDISGGRLQTRSVTDGHLFIAGDTSLNGNLYVGGDISWNPNNLADNSIPSSAIIGGVVGATGPAGPAGSSTEIMILTSTGTNNTNATLLYNLQWDIHGSVNMLADPQAIRSYGTGSQVYNSNHTVSALTMLFNAGVYKVTISGRRGETTDEFALAFDLDNDNVIAYMNGNEEFQSHRLGAGWDVVSQTYTFVVPHVANFHWVERNLNHWYDYNATRVQLLFERTGIPPFSGTDDTLHCYGNIPIITQRSITGGLYWSSTVTKPTNSNEYIDISESGSEWIYRIDPNTTSSIEVTSFHSDADLSLNKRLFVGEFINTSNFYNVNSLLMPYYLVEWTNPSVGNIDTTYHDFRELFKAGKLHTNIHSNQLSIEAGTGGLSDASVDPDNYVAFKVYPGVWELNFELNETGVGSNANANYVHFYLYHDNGSGTTMIHNSHATSFTSSNIGYLKDFRYLAVPNGKSGWLRIWNYYSQTNRRMVVRNTGVTMNSASNIIPTVHLKCIQLNNWDGTDSSLTGVDSMNSASIVSDWNNQNAIDYNTATNVFVNQI